MHYEASNGKVSIGNIGNTISGVYEQAISNTTDLIERTINAINDIHDIAVENVSNYIEQAVNTVQEVANAAQELQNDIANNVTDAIENFVNKVQESFNKLSDNIGNLIDAAKDIADDIKNNIKETFESIRDAWNEIKENVKNSLKDWWENFKDDISNKWLDWVEDPNGWINNPFKKVRDYYIVDPVVLDLDGDGIETLAHAKNKGAMFDFDGDGLKNATGWVKSDDGILVFDRNGDGLINDGREIFGDSTVKSDGTTAKHGFDALADLDSNKDGKITAEDVDFAKLKVWQDKNQDGISQAGELKTLTELGITALNLNYQDTNETLAGDNQLAQRSSYEKADGSTLTMGDVNFRFDTFYSEYIEKTPVSDDIKALPNLVGAGRVRSLHEAMQQSEDLRNLVMQYAQATTKSQQKQILPSLLFSWAIVGKELEGERIRNNKDDFEPKFAQATYIIHTENIPAGAIGITPHQVTLLQHGLPIEERDIIKKYQEKYNVSGWYVTVLN